MSHDNKPLTLEELRNMDDVPVYIQDLYGEGRDGWHIISWDSTRSGRYLVLTSKNCNGFLIDEYGESWLAYAQKPIDFDKWPPCVHCKGCGNCVYFLYDDEEFPCNRCLRGSTSNNPYPKFNPVGFCKFCGRPLTNEAREMLERRLTGHNNEQ